MAGRLLLNLAMLVVVGVLAWTALRPDPPPAGRGDPITSKAPNEVRRIVLERASGPRIVLERDGPRWRLNEPIGAVADPLRSSALAALAATTSRGPLPVADRELSEFGLEPPRAVVQLDELRIALGSVERVSGRRYLQVNGRVHLVEDTWFSHLSASPAAFADRRLLSGDADLVEIALPDATWRHASNGWRRDPEHAAYGAERGAALAQAWRRARALSVGRLDAARPWSASVAVRVAGEAAATEFRLAHEPEAFWVARPDLELEYRFLPRQAESLLDRAQH